MLTRLLDLFGGDRPAAPDASPETALHRAAAALLAVTARIDGTFDAAEQRTVHALIRDRFDLSEEESAALIDTASESAADSTDLFEFTETINRQLAPEKRADIIEMLWEVAYADGTADDYETNLVRRAAGLLYVSDRDSGLARQRVLQRLGIGTT
jgi:uncharacterized tellurite resistance protein B-like protein